MNTDEFRRMYEKEDRHWWFCGKRRLAANLLARYGPAMDPPGRPTIADIGCGTGGNLAAFSAAATAVGIDLHPQSLEGCRKRGLTLLVQGSAERPPLKRDRFDAACLLDVLYHRGIGDDRAVMRRIFGILKPGGTLLVTDSACPALFGRHDRALHARQRYRRRELVDKLAASGFTVAASGHFNTLLFAPAAVFRLASRRYRTGGADRSDLFDLPAFLNLLLKAVLYVEADLAGRVPLPFGLSVWAAARRPPSEDGAA